MIIPQRLELPISRTVFQVPKDIRAIAVRRYLFLLIIPMRFLCCNCSLYVGYCNCTIVSCHCHSFLFSRYFEKTAAYTFIFWIIGPIVGFFEDGGLLMYTLEGVSSATNFITAYEESQ